MNTLDPVIGTSPYCWPWNGPTPIGQVALVLAGWDTGWRQRVARPAVNEIHALDVARCMVARGGTVISLCHRPPPRSAPCGPTPGPLRLPFERAIRLRAAGVDGFWGSPLDHTLRDHGITHLLLAGHGLEGPVHSTLRSANDRGYECLLVVDAASAVQPSMKGQSCAMVQMSGGIFGATGSATAVVASLGSRAEFIPSGRIPS